MQSRIRRFLSDVSPADQRRFGMIFRSPADARARLRNGNRSRLPLPAATFRRRKKFRNIRIPDGSPLTRSVLPRRCSLHTHPPFMVRRSQILKTFSRASSRAHTRDKKIPPVVRRDRSSEPVAQNPPGECSHCRYLSIASGSNAVHSIGHPIRRSTSETVGHKSCRINI